MIFHKLGENTNPIIVLIHGCFQPWQSILPIAEHFEEDYHVIIPALNGHTSEEGSRFTSIENEAKEIENYILSEYGKDVYAVCGLSMGGAVAYTILINGILNINNVILDGAPLLASGKFVTKVMTKNYLSIARKSKARDKATLRNFSKNFLPEKYLENFLSFIDRTDEESIINMLESINKNRISAELRLNTTKLLYMHGTKGNEVISKKVGKYISKNIPQAYVVCHKGDGHCECAIYEPDDWAQIAADFFENR